MLRIGAAPPLKPVTITFEFVTLTGGLHPLAVDERIKALAASDSTFCIPHPTNVTLCAKAGEIDTGTMNMTLPNEKRGFENHQQGYEECERRRKNDLRR